MTEEIELRALAEQVRRVIRSDPRDGATALVMFASTNARAPRLTHEAFVLKLNHQEASSDQERQEVEREMLALVGRIEDERPSHTGVVRLQRPLVTAPPQPTDPVVVAEQLGKQFSRGAFHLRGLDLALRPGEITAVVGQNAHGKTTLLRMIAGELRCDEGKLTYPALSGREGQDWVRIKSQIAFLPQDLPAWHGTLADNLHYAASLHGIFGAENERQVEFFIERLGLREHLDKRWSELSGGYRLRFALAQVLVGKPRLLILDEPLANLDVLAQHRLLQDIVDLACSRRYPLAVLMSSQHLHELEAVSQCIVFLRKGEVVFNGPARSIGLNRTHNLYEIGTFAGVDELRSVFREQLIADPIYNGVSYVIKTVRELEPRDVLERMLAAEIEVHYFRDVSRSVKSLFEEGASA